MAINSPHRSAIYPPSTLTQALPRPFTKMHLNNTSRDILFHAVAVACHIIHSSPPIVLFVLRSVCETLAVAPLQSPSASYILSPRRTRPSVRRSSFVRRSASLSVAAYSSDKTEVYGQDIGMYAEVRHGYPSNTSRVDVARCRCVASYHPHPHPYQNFTMNGKSFTCPIS